MSELVLSQSRLRVGGWLPPYSPPLPDGETRGAHRADDLVVPPPPAERIVAAPVPERRYPRLLLVTGAVVTVLTVGTALASDRPAGPPAAVVSLGALPPGAPTLSPASSGSPSGSAPGPSPVPSSPKAADRADRSRSEVPSLPSGRGAASGQSKSASAGSGGTAPMLPVGRTVSLAPASRPAERVRHSGSQVRVDLISATNSAAVRADADFVIRAGLADATCVSFESAEQPGRFLQKRGSGVYLQESDGGESFSRESTFCAAAATGGGVALRLKSDPGRLLAAQGTRVTLDPADRPDESMIFLIRPPL